MDAAQKSTNKSVKLIRLLSSAVTLSSQPQQSSPLHKTNSYRTALPRGERCHNVASEVDVDAAIAKAAFTEKIIIIIIGKNVDLLVLLAADRAFL